MQGQTHFVRLILSIMYSHIIIVLWSGLSYTVMTSLAETTRQHEELNRRLTEMRHASFWCFCLSLNTVGESRQQFEFPVCVRGIKPHVINRNHACILYRAVTQYALSCHPVVCVCVCVIL